MNVETPQYVSHEAVHLALSMCAGCDVRYAMRRPFLRGRYVYATNGIIIARVPDWAAPWVVGVKDSPNPDNLPWGPDRYANQPTEWAKFPEPDVPICDRCQAFKDEGCEPERPNCADVHELLDFADPPQICKSCGMYTAFEVGSDYQLGEAWFNARQCRKIATIGAKMYAPLHPGKDNLEAWRWEIAELFMTGLLMPVKRS